MVDSPVALATWIAEKYQGWSDNTGDPSCVFTREKILDNIMLYWLPAAGASAARIYWETAGKLAVDPVTVPVGSSIFPREFYRPSLRWAKQVFPGLRYWNELAREATSPPWSSPRHSSVRSRPPSADSTS